MFNDGRIRDERFRQDRKRTVDYSKHYRDRTGLVASDPVVQKNLLTIIRCLTDGDLIPEKLYRNGIGRDTDHMLANHGIKHLHLHEDTDVDCLLFLIEYPDSVLLLEVDGHRQHFNKPAGSLLAQLHQSEIINADTKTASKKANLLASLKAGLRLKRGERKADE